MLRDSLDYPRTNDDAVKTLLIGGILTLASVLLLPTVVVFGYLQRVLRWTVDGDDESPVFDEWEALFVDGLKATAVTLAYFAVPAVVTLVTVIAVLSVFSTSVVVSDSGVVAEPTASAAAGSLLAFAFLAVGTLVTVVWTLAALYVLPAGLARLATTDRMGAAFARRDLWPTVTTGGYATAWLLALAVSLGAGVVMGVVSAIPAIGAVAAAFVYFYANVVAFRLYGEGVVRATPVESGPEVEIDEQVA